MNAPARLLTPEQAAERLHVKARTLKKLRDERGLRYVEVSPRVILFREADLEEYIEQQVKRKTKAEKLCPSPSTTKTRPIGNMILSSKVIGFSARRA